MKRPTHRKNNREWVPGPKAWRTRDAEPCHVTAIEICKELWPAPGSPVTPKWAEAAYRRHWITYLQRAKVPKVPCELSRKLDDLWKAAPLLGLIKKDRMW